VEDVVETEDEEEKALKEASGEDDVLHRVGLLRRSATG
jgi:hypothetical protein